MSPKHKNTKGNYCYTIFARYISMPCKMIIIRCRFFLQICTKLIFSFCYQRPLFSFRHNLEQMCTKESNNMQSTKNRSLHISLFHTGRNVDGQRPVVKLNCI